MKKALIHESQPNLIKRIYHVVFRKNYIGHLKTMGPQLLFYMIETKRWSQFSMLEAGAALPKDVIEAGIEYGRQKNVPEFVSVLMQYKNAHYPSMMKTFEL